MVGGRENFASLSIDVDSADFAHDNRAFFSLFTPSVRRSWNGNLKGYFVDRTGLADINGMPATVITDNGTQFSDDAQSFRSSSNDGNNVGDGGASEKLLTGTRKLLTHTGPDIPLSGIALNQGNNHRLRKENNFISDAMLGLPYGSGMRAESLDWIQNAPMGDPLHSKSVSVNYGNRQVVYIMTNQGLLHAIDATTPTDPTASDNFGGDEFFAFMPQRLLTNLPALVTDADSGEHIYGLDGSITPWQSDDNSDGIVNNGEDVLLIMGMRRGGSAYIGLDVSNPDSPRLQWTIDNTGPLLPDLAQSWSRMSLITVNDGGAKRQVLAFGADTLDNAAAPTPSRGNAIYMVDRNGGMVWSATSDDHASMAYSIASDLTVIDTDGDSVADRLYVGDVGGQVWRVDFEDIRRAPEVTLFADLDDGHQPIFYPPSVARIQNRGDNYLAISPGTGNRTNPLQTGTQHFLYMLRDNDIKKGAPRGPHSTLTGDDLYDSTSNAIDAADTALAAVTEKNLQDAGGWKIALSPDEQALSAVVTFEGKLLATTFEAQTSADAAACGFETIGRFYHMDIGTARTAVSSTNSTTQTAAQRNRLLQSSGIPSSPVVVFTKGAGAARVIVDKESVSLIDRALKRVYWHAK